MNKTVQVKNFSPLFFMFFMSLFTFALIIGLDAEAKVNVFAPVKMLTQPGDHVVIKGFRGNVEYFVNNAVSDVTVELKQQVKSEVLKHQDEWQFLFKRDGSEIQILIEGPTSKFTWSDVAATAQMPEYFIKVTGPLLPVNINWNEGQIAVSDLNSELHIAALKADIAVLRGEGDLTITNQEGSVVVRNRKGAVKIDSYRARVEVQNIEGKFDIENFVGESRVQNVIGNVSLNSYKGTSKMSNIKGRLEFKNGNSPLHIDKFEGELRGRSAQGAVYAEIKGEADVRLESAEGAVNLQLPTSGAWVNLGTTEGLLAVPAFLKLTRLPTQQIRTGRLKGSSGGSIFVRTTSGDIRIR